MKLVRTPLRISLCGGGTDCPKYYENNYGAVLSFSINKYIYITAKPNVSLYPHKYRLVYSQVEECNSRDEIKHPIIRQLVSDYGLGALDLDVMSDIPAGTGMGSSSAFTVGMHLALGKTRDKHELAQLACVTELCDLKEPIGKQDQYAAAFGGINYITFTNGATRVNPILLNSPQLKELRDSLHLVYVGGTRSASQLLSEQIKEGNHDILDAMRDLAFDAQTELRCGNIKDLGRYILHGWELKKKLSPNVSTNEVDYIISQALAYGATGAKLLGAGGAGFVLLFCPVENRDKMLSGLSRFNLNYVNFDFDFMGAKVLYENSN